MNRKGITLIELIIFILVGAVFLPLAYVVFTSAVKDSMKPETAAKTKAIAEAKMTDIIHLTYDAIIPTLTAYLDVNQDKDNNPDPRFADTSYAGFQWKLAISYTVHAFVKNSSGYVTSINMTASPGARLANKKYEVGDYIKEGNYFYRVYFPQWQATSTEYRVNDFVRIANGTYYKRLPPDVWTSSPTTPYAIGIYVSPSAGNAYYYQLTSNDCPASSIYTGGPSWPSNPSPGTTVSEQRSANSVVCNYTWTEDTTGYNNLPSTIDPAGCTSMCNFSDSFRWQQLSPSLISGSEILDFSTHTSPKGTEFNDGEVRWKESTVYKLIKVSVLPPGCLIGTVCELVSSTLASARNYTPVTGRP